MWELSLQLEKLGHHVTVVCERCYHEKPKGIAVYELGEIAPRPRWLSALRFDLRVKKWLKASPQHDAIIHSHERTSFHDITTFHGAIFGTVREQHWWRLISPRVAMNLFLERRALTVAKCIVPNSQLIKQQLAQYYPNLLLPELHLVFPVSLTSFHQTGALSALLEKNGSARGWHGLWQLLNSYAAPVPIYCLL